MKIYHLKFKIPPIRQNICLGNGIYVENGDELLVMDSLGKSILLNYKRFITSSEQTEVRSLSCGYYSLIKSVKSKVKVELEKPTLEFSADRSLARKVRARRKKIDPS